MFFRNLTLFRFSAAVAEDLCDLEAALEEHRLHPCGALEMSSRGFLSPVGPDADAMALQVDQSMLVCIGSEDKILPASVVNAEVTRRVQELSEAEGRRIGGRERKRIKQATLDVLLPRAFARPSRVQLWLQRKHGWAVFDTSSRKAAEQGLQSVREALGSFPAVPLAPERSVRQIMTDWLSTGDLPSGLALADECELRDPANASGAVSRSRHQELESEEIREHLRAGKQVFQLGLEFDDHIGFVLGEDLTIRKLRFFDVVTDELVHSQADSAASEIQARFALMALDLDRLLAKLDQWFGLPRPSEHGL